MYYSHRLLIGACVIRHNSFIEFFMRCHIIFVCLWIQKKFFCYGEAVFYLFIYLFKICVNVSKVVIHSVRYIFSYHLVGSSGLSEMDDGLEKTFCFF